MAADALHHLQTIKLGHLNIGDHPLRWLMKIRGIPKGAVVRSAYVKTFLAKDQGNNIRQAFIVFNDQNGLLPWTWLIPP